MSAIPTKLERRAERSMRAIDARTGGSPALKWLLRYVFPDHWSFMLGEIALYSFVVLVATGIFLTFFYVPSAHHVSYSGPYTLLDHQVMSQAYKSVVDISWQVPAGLLMRQTHHWAADVFLAAITLHLLRIFFTGAFRKPRDFNWYVGLTMLGLAMLEGYLGYSMVDDLLSGMGLAIGYSVAFSIPGIGGQFAYLIWGGQYPGTESFFMRLEIIHVLLIPLALIALITVHLAMIMRQHHSQFPGPGRTERNVVGTPTWPGYALRSLGLLFAVAGVLFLLGGLIQINPIWQWGPYEPYLSTNGAQPDWYIGWLIGAMRLMPNYEAALGGVTFIPSPFWGGVLFPTFVFGVLFAWPSIERRLTGDRRHHDLLDRPRDHPVRTAFGAAFFTWVAVIFFIGASDRLRFRLGISYTSQIHFWRAGVWVLPVVVYFFTRWLCRALRRSGTHPTRGWGGQIVTRREDGSVATLAEDAATGRLDEVAGRADAPADLQ